MLDSRWKADVGTRAVAWLGKAVGSLACGQVLSLEPGSGVLVQTLVAKGIGPRKRQSRLALNVWAPGST